MLETQTTPRTNARLRGDPHLSSVVCAGQRDQNFEFAVPHKRERRWEFPKCVIEMKQIRYTTAVLLVKC